MELTTTRLKELLVPVDGSEASLEAVAIACSIAKRNKGKMFLVHVVEVPRSRSLDADLGPETQRGEEVLNEAERLARSLDCEAEGELLQAREVGHAVVDEAIERAVDGIVVGIKHRATEDEEEAPSIWERGEKPRSLPGASLGGVSHHILHHAPCEVILIRLPGNTWS